MEYKLFFNWAKQNFLLKYFTKKHYSIFYIFTKKQNTLKMHSKALSSLFSIMYSYLYIKFRDAHIRILENWEK